MPPTHARLPDPVYVTRPSLVSLERYHELLEQIWQSRQLTNNGPFHRELESELQAYLEADQLSLFCNGTLALLVALQALRIDGGEVITTPFTFPATAHVLYWNRVRPVFCDIEPRTFNLDPARIEELIGPETKAILPVHVFGNPCDIDAIQTIAERHGLHVIYDAAHAFGVRYRGRPLAGYGDLSILSFHATKIFTTFEGGALITNSEAQKRRVDSLKNFGIAGEETVIGPGINGKMNELQAAYGVLQLREIGEEIERRASIAHLYRSLLADVPGISCGEDLPDVEQNHSYFPIRVEASRYGTDRDDLCEHLKAFNVFCRKYFFPLCSQYPMYAALPSAAPEKLPVAERVATEILCLPIFGDLEETPVRLICDVIREHATGS